MVIKESWKIVISLSCFFMNQQYNIQDWEILISSSALSPKEKDGKIDLARNAFENDVPVILDLEHLSILLGIKSGVLNNMINKPASFYRQFKIPKKRGGLRDIVTPHTSLLEVQRWIAFNILSRFEIHDSAYAYVKSKNVAQNSSVHLGCTEMLKIDLKDFFPSITFPRVRELFKRLGYSKEITYYLTNLCCLNNSIPQGAATSPIISNVILLNLDKRLNNLCSNNNIRYSRYADDLIFSGADSVLKFKNLFEKNIKSEGFRINELKTKEYHSMHRKMVTGIVVGSDKISLPKSKKREIRQEVYYLLKYGILEQSKRFNDIFYVERILGRLSYWKQIETENDYVLKSIATIKIMNKELIKKLSRDINENLEN